MLFKDIRTVLERAVVFLTYKWPDNEWITKDCSLLPPHVKSLLPHCLTIP